MRVLLVGPCQEDNLSLRYLASSLAAAGHEVELAPFTSPAEADAVVQQAAGFDLIGLSLSFQARAREFLGLARRLKADGRRVVVGGHYASCAADELLAHHPELDAIVLHEGEETLVELANGRPLEQIKGLAWRSGDQVVRTDPRPILKDLDTLPFPDRRGRAHLFAGVPTAYMLGSRGCVSQCDYCCIMALHRLAPGPRLRRRAPERIADEMAALYHERGVRQFIFHDDNFLVPSVRTNHERLEAFEQAFAARGLTDLGLVIKCRPADAERSVFERLQRMGLVRVFLGVESASPEGLASIGRKQSVTQAAAALELCHDLGISAQYTLMCFHPDATLATLRADVAFFREHLDHALDFCRTEAYAGTPLERRMIEAGRARGTYLARTYDIGDPVAALATEVAVKVFVDRCWSPGSLMERTIGLDHLAGVVDRFHTDPSAKRFAAELRAWRLEVNRELVDLLELLIEAAAHAGGVDGPAFRAEVAALVERERRTRSQHLAQAERLRRRLETFVLETVGFSASRGLLPRRGPFAALARHAAAVALAVSSTGGAACMFGVSEYAARPLDSDGDGLPDNCEVTWFGTDPAKVDSDGDGLQDGAEVSGTDGLTNLEVYQSSGEWECETPRDGGTANPPDAGQADTDGGTRNPDGGS